MSNHARRHMRTQAHIPGPEGLTDVARLGHGFLYNDDDDFVPFVRVLFVQNGAKMDAVFPVAAARLLAQALLAEAVASERCPDLSDAIRKRDS